MRKVKHNNLLCKLNMHQPLTKHDSNFVDVVSGKTVFNAECPCGIKWLTDSSSKWFGFKIKKEHQ